MLTRENNLFVWSGPYQDRYMPEEAGFRWSPSRKVWFTDDPYIAHLLSPAPWISGNIAASQQQEPLLEATDGMYPFQAAGVEVLADQMRRRRSLLLADEQGLGKTIQALGVANVMGFRKLLVICPASLRLNWAREMEKWHHHNPGIIPILSGKDKLDHSRSVVASYNFAGAVGGYKPDMLIVDEIHSVKNAGAQRTKAVLGDGRDIPGLVRGVPALFLTGTPTPNGRPNELWPVLFRCAPDVISGMRYTTFLRRFCRLLEDGTSEPLILGAKRERELYTRLRGSGFMVRRLKKDVLKDLPPKRYKMVVFPVTGATARVLKKEEPFSVKEIATHGIPVGSALPEIRQEMALAKLPQALEYIGNLLTGGADKVVVFGHHLEVMGLLEEGLRDYRPVMIVGGTPQRKRQAAVDTFQNDPGCRVFLGNEAAEEGITLTSAADVVLVEPEWVPGKNEQRADRLHRIGQTRGVVVHLLVVEKSLDAKILGSAARKSGDILAVLEGGSA